MFDTIKTLWLGFSGGLKDYPEGRKMIWALLITFIAGWIVAAFAAWVSYPAYRGVIQYLPGADHIALFFTGAVAMFLYFALAYLSGFSVERWLSSPFRSYRVLGARIFGAAAVLFLVIDFYMNMTGKDARATEAAGAVAVYEYTTPESDLQTIQAAQNKLENLEAGKVGGYGWRDPKTGIFWLNKSGKSAAADLRATIRRTQQADSTNRAAFLADQATANERRAAVEASAKATLKNAVYGVYFLLGILCIVQAYIVEAIQLEGAGDNPQGANGGKVGQSTRQPKKTQQSATTTATAGRAITATGGGYQIVCQHCGNEAVMKSHLAKYCCDECRESAFEARTGAKVQKGKTRKPGRIGF